MGRVIAAKMFAVELVTAVHGDRLVPVVFANASSLAAGLEVRQAVCRDRRRIDEHDRAAVRFGLVRRKLEQIQGPLDVHVMCRHRRELRAGRQQRREVKNQVDFELGQNALQQVDVENRSGHLAMHEPRDVRVQSVDVERDDPLMALFDQIGHQSVTDFPVGAGDQDDWFAHGLWFRLAPDRLRYYM